MAQFNMCDTKLTDGFYVSFERIDEHDPDADPKDYLFQDDDYREQDQARLDAWHNDEWSFIGIRARARCMLVRNHTGTSYRLVSTGLWGIESDSGAEYLESVYQEQIAELKSVIEAMNAPIYR